MVLDVETNALNNPTNLWCVVLKDVDTGTVYHYTWDNISAFKDMHTSVTEYIGHNLISFDIPQLESFLSISFEGKKVTDTLILSRLLKFDLDGGHSLEAWGIRLGYPKVGLDVDFSRYSQELLDRCISDVEITCKLYLLLKTKILDRDDFKQAVEVEHDIAKICRQMQTDGFKFDVSSASQLRDQLGHEIAALDDQLKIAFPPKIKPVRVVTPRLTQHGTLSKVGIPRDWTDLTSLSAGAPFTLIRFEEFNPGSSTQIIERLNQAGWDPVDKTAGHIQAETSKEKDKLRKFREVGWKVNENNLATLSDSAPMAARTLVKRLLLSGRHRTLTEWLEHYNSTTGRVHGTFSGIGTWTHRMSHKEPNLANVAAPKSIKYKGAGMAELAIDLGSRMRKLWTSTDDDWWLVGTDAVGIQLRIFAHYINDPLFIHAVTKGTKENGDDPHTLNARILGVDRDTAKTFRYWKSLNQLNSGNTQSWAILI